MKVEQSTLNSTNTKNRRGLLLEALEVAHVRLFQWYETWLVANPAAGIRQNIENCTHNNPYMPISEDIHCLRMTGIIKAAQLVCNRIRVALGVHDAILQEQQAQMIAKRLKICQPYYQKGCSPLFIETHLIKSVLETADEWTAAIEAASCPEEAITKYMYIRWINLAGIHSYE